MPSAKKIRQLGDVGAITEPEKRRLLNADADARRSMVNAILARQKKRGKAATAAKRVSNPFENVRALKRFAKERQRQANPRKVRSQ